MPRFTRPALSAAAALLFTAAAPAALADIKIGLMVPLTGFAAADGKSAHEGAKLAVAQANAKGGINGEKVELVVYDDQASPKEAVPAASDWPKSFLTVISATFFLPSSFTSLAPARPCTSPMAETRNM